MATKLNKKPSALSLKTSFDDHKDHSPQLSASPCKPFPRIDGEDEDDHLGGNLPDKEPNSKKTTQHASQLNHAQRSHDDCWKYANCLSNYLSDTVGRSQTDIEKAEEEERYWDAAGVGGKHQHVDVEQMCSGLRARILNAPTQPLSPSYNHIILKIIEALEKATFKLNGMEPGAARTSESPEAHSSGALRPIETKDNLYEIVMNQGRRSPHASEKAGKIRLLDITISPKRPPRKHRSKSEQPNSKRGHEHGNALKSPLFPGLGPVKSRENTSKASQPHSLAPSTPSSPRKHRLFETKQGKVEKPLPAVPDIIASAKSKAPISMAAIASKIAFAGAKCANRATEPEAASQLPMLRASQNDPAGSSTPAVVQIAGRIQPSAANSGNSMRTGTKHRRQRSQSESQTRRRFSFTPGDDAEVATFVIPSQSPSSHSWEVSLGKPAQNGTKIAELGRQRGRGSSDNPLHETKSTIRQIQEGS